MKKVNVQKFGGFITNMVMPNIGAFIAWGLLTACFIPTGWFPNAELNKMISPMLKYMLPLLIAYTGGKQVGDVRGGVIGVIASMGCIVASDIPMFLGAMILGPLGGYLIKKWDGLIDGKIPVGFEMVVNNFSLGILGMLLAIGSFLTLGPLLAGVNGVLQTGLGWMVQRNLLPLLSIVNEPAKVLFLNNAIEQGIYNPLGMQDALVHGKSIYFMLESSPGAGLGLLIAYSFFGRGESKESAPTAIIIHFFGGIHEIYFPYVLANPVTILSMIFGGMSGVITFQLFGAGLVAFPSPGSIFSFLALTPRGGYVATILGIIVATGVSFLITSAILKIQNRHHKDDEVDDFEDAVGKVAAMKAETKGTSWMDQNLSGVKKIVFVCDAGMGSSAMGASAFANKVKKAGLPIGVTNTSIENMPADADLVVVQNRLFSRAQKVNKDMTYVQINNYINDPENDRLLEKLKKDYASKAGGKAPQAVVQGPEEGKALDLNKKNIFYNLPAMDRDEAIQFAGEQLKKLGYVNDDYIKSMHEKETMMSTYVGNGIAIPHGTDKAKKDVLNSGIVMMRFKEGVDWNGEKAYLVIGIAGVGNEHLEILSRVATVLISEDFVKELVSQKTVDDFIAFFKKGEKEAY